MKIDGVYEIAIPVRDLPRAEKFYREVLGFEVGLRDEKRPWVFLRIGGRSGMIVLQETRAEFAPLHFAFTVERGAIAGLARELAARGVGASGPHFHEWMPASSVYFSDPDGHALELCAPGEAP